MYFFKIGLSPPLPPFLAQNLETLELNFDLKLGFGTWDLGLGITIGILMSD